MIVAGIGCRKGTPAPAIVAVVRAALAASGGLAQILATSSEKACEPGIIAAAAELGLELRAVTVSDMQAVGHLAVTRSVRVQILKGVPSVAETAALAVAGPGATLLVPRIALGPATCAIAVATAAGSGSDLR